MEEVVLLDPNKATDTFNRLNQKYLSLKKDYTDENYEEFVNELDNATKTIHTPIEEKINEYLKKAKYDMSSLSGFSVRLEMNAETIKLWQLIQIALDENSKYWEDKSKKVNK